MSPIYFGTDEYDFNGFEKVFCGGDLVWQKQIVPHYAYITPVDPVAFPPRNGLKMITLDGTETWTASNGACYTNDFTDDIRTIRREVVVGYCAEFEFLPDASTTSDMTDASFIFNGNTASSFTNGNMSFKSGNTSTVSAWKNYLLAHPVDILIGVYYPDASVWKPAMRLADGVTGYWNGADGFVAVHGGIPYLGDNLITDAVIAGAYDNAWISTNYVWTTASGSASFAMPVIADRYYRIAWDNTDSDVVGAVFRYGFTDDNTPSSSNVLTAPRARTTPQGAQSVDVKATADYIIIQVASGLFPTNTGHLAIREMVGYTPPALLMGGNPNPEPEPEPIPDEEGEL